MALLNPRNAWHQFLCVVLAVITAIGPAATAVGQALSGDDGQNFQLVEPAGDPAPPRQRVGAASDKALLDRQRHTPLEVVYTLPNAALVLAIRPAQILSSPIAELMPTEILQAAMVKELGLDPLAAEQVVVSVAPPLDGPPSYTVYTRFNQPIALKPSEMTQHTEQATVKDKQYLRSRELMLPSYYSVDEKSLLAAPDFTLLQLVNRDAVPPVGGLAASLAAQAKGDDLLALVDVAALRPLIQMGMAQAELPPELASLREIPNLVKLVEFRVNFTQSAPSQLIVTANNEADAERLVAMFNDAKRLIAEKIAEEGRKSLASEDPVEQAAGRYSARMAKVFEERTQLDREGDSLVLFRSDLTSQDGNPMVSAATVGILIALLLPAVQAAREAARRNSSLNNLKQIMLSLLFYESEKKAFPAYANFDDQGKPLLSWRVHMLPYLEQQALYEQFQLDEPWDSEHNKQLISQMPELFIDPSSKLTPADGKTHYLGVKGKEYFFDGTANGRQMKAITDGTSNTIAIVQVGDAAAATWTKPDDWQPDEKNLLKPFDGPRPGFFFVGMSDGSVQSVGTADDPKPFQASLTVAGGEH